MLYGYPNNPNQIHTNKILFQNRCSNMPDADPFLSIAESNNVNHK